MISKAYAIFLKSGVAVTTKNKKYESLMYLAMKGGFSEQVSLLLDNGTDVNKRGPSGITSLIFCKKRK